jgi:hypothetical protein
MLESENNKIIDYLKQKGLDVSEENTLGMNNRIDSFKIGDKFHISPKFIYRFSNDNFSFNDAISCDSIKQRFNSKFEDVFIVKKKILKVTRKNKHNYAFIEAENTRTKEKHIIIKDYPELHNLSTFYLLLYIN